MSYTLQVKAVAIRQAGEAFAYYQEKLPGLGERFIAEILDAYDTLKSNPMRAVRKPPFPLPATAQVSVPFDP